MAKTVRPEPKVSIIIPCKTIDNQTRRCVDFCLKTVYKDIEILILPDNNDKIEVDGLIQIIPTGPMKPMAKRYVGESQSKGVYCAFIDSDAYPSKNWIKNSIRHFENLEVAAVVGPSKTPESANLLAKASGLVLASPLGGGTESIRYNQNHSNMQYVTEAPTCNFVIRKSILKKIKDSVIDVWPGEEIVLCGLLTKKLKKKIIYDPQLVVYHDRRRLFIPHLRQIWAYGAVKGYLVKKYSQYVRPIFFLPSLLVLGLGFGLPLAIFNHTVRSIFTLFLSVYLLLSLWNGLMIGLIEASIKVVILVTIGTILTHMCYGISFFRGIFIKKL